MKKLFAPLICALLCAVVLCTPALAAGESPSVVINGEPMEVSDAPAKLVQGRTMIPFRSVFLALGFADEDIHWNSATRTISATKGTVTVSFTIDQKQVTVLRDGDAVTTPTDVAPYLDPETNRTYIPARYVAEALFTTVHNSSHLQSHFLRLLVAITEDEPDVEEIERIISTDAMLTYSLLKIVNSGYFALRNRATEVHQAIVIMGLGQLRQWIYLLSMGNSDGGVDDSQEEFLKLSFTRATFCSELMRYAKNMPITRNDAYLMGMFSTLNFLIAAPMEEILSQVPISEEVKVALLSGEGRCGDLYHLVRSYERADWKEITRLAEKLSIPTEQLTNAYFRCVNEVNNIWSQLMEVSPDIAASEVKPESLL